MNEMLCFETLAHVLLMEARLSYVMLILISLS